MFIRVNPCTSFIEKITMRELLPLLLGSLLLAALLREDAILTVFYVLIGAALAGYWWSRRALAAVEISREFEPHAFWREAIPVRITLHNRGWLPVVWLRLQESAPAGLGELRPLSLVTTLPGHSRAQFTYTLCGEHRGYYPIGPLRLASGDLLGVATEEERESQVAYLTVYPAILPLPHFALPSRSPLGTLRHHRPIFEDPSRVRGKRDYVAGDSMRRVDWKATAASGRLQVKLFEPSIALEVVVMLDLHADDYDLRTRVDSTELAVVAAASVANWVVQHKQPVGLVCSGVDPLHASMRQALPPRKDRGHLSRCLDILARIQPGETTPAVRLLAETLPQLAWGTTLVLITGQVDEALLATGLQAQRRGVNLAALVCSRVGPPAQIKRHAAQVSFPVTWLRSEKDLEGLSWR